MKICKKYLFLMTHIGSGWEKLVSKLELDTRIQVYQTDTTYSHPSNLSFLKSQIHKSNNSASIRCDVLFHNKNFTMKRLCDYYKFIFWTDTFESSLPDLLKHYDLRTAELYWSYRMSGLREYHLRCKNSLWNPSLDDEGIFRAFF